MGSPTFNAPASQPQASGGGNGGAPRQRVRARRGQATDPHSIAERVSFNTHLLLLFSYIQKLI